MKKTKNRECYKCKGKNTQAINLRTKARNRSRLGVLREATIAHSRVKERMGRKLIRLGTRKSKEIAFQQTKPIEQMLNITTSSQNYQETTPGMNLMLNLIKVISRTQIWFKQLLETVIFNGRVEIPTL